MIIDSFDDKSMAKINPKPKENRLKCDACIVTFSNIIEEYVLKNYNVERCSTYKMVTGTFPIFKINYNGKIFAFYKTFLGAPASDYIKIKNANKVASFMESKKIPYILGKNWTTDSFYRETENNIAKRKADGCISVEMECSAMQAVCDFRGLELYYFLTSGDLLDAPEWDERHVEGEYAGTQHDTRHFDIAIELANSF